MMICSVKCLEWPRYTVNVGRFPCICYTAVRRPTVHTTNNYITLLFLACFFLLSFHAWLLWRDHPPRIIPVMAAVVMTGRRVRVGEDWWAHYWDHYCCHLDVLESEVIAFGQNQIVEQLSFQLIFVSWKLPSEISQITIPHRQSVMTCLPELTTDKS